MPYSWAIWCSGRDSSLPEPNFWLGTTSAEDGVVSHDLQHILDALLDGIVVIDAHGVVERINSGACRLLQVSADTALGRSLRDLLPEDHPILAAAQSTQDRGRGSVEDELLLRRGPLAKDVLIDLSSSPLIEGRGTTTGVVLVLRDRTIHAALREVVSERERHEAFGNIASGIAHEVKNPLGGIRGAAELMGMRSKDPKVQETSSLIVREVDRIANLVDELMVFGRGDKLQLEPVNLHLLLDEVLELLSHDPLGQAVEVKRLYDPSIPDLPADRNRLTQVFLNLMRNALQAMAPEGGRLEVRTRVALDQRLTTGHGTSCPTVVIKFIDTGLGVPDEALEQLPTPFFTTRTEGTGLGLPVAVHWIAKHGGTFHIENNSDRGATVRIALPLRRNYEQ